MHRTITIKIKLDHHTKFKPLNFIYKFRNNKENVIPILITKFKNGKMSIVVTDPEPYRSSVKFTFGFNRIFRSSYNINSELVSESNVNRTFTFKNHLYYTFSKFKITLYNTILKHEIGDFYYIEKDFNKSSLKGVSTSQKGVEDISSTFMFLNKINTDYYITIEHITQSKSFTVWYRFIRIVKGLLIDV